MAGWIPKAGDVVEFRLDDADATPARLAVLREYSEREDRWHVEDGHRLIRLKGDGTTFGQGEWKFVSRFEPRTRRCLCGTEIAADHDIYCCDLCLAQLFGAPSC